MAFNKIFNYKDPQLDEELRRLIQELALQPAWIAPTFQNAWVDFGSPDTLAGYHKDQFGWVHIKGKVKTGTIGLSIFTLPVGYRPLEDYRFAVTSNGAFGSVKISTSGTVVCDIGNNAYVELNGISFRTV